MPTTERIQVQISGMTCTHCEQSVRDALEQVPGVLAVDSVSYRAPQATLVADPSVTPDAIERALGEAGYRGRIVNTQAG